LSTKQPKNQHSRIRSDHATEVAEDYVEAIAEITSSAGACRAVDLATLFAVSHVTVNRTVGRLVRDGFAKTEPYRPIELTAKGKRLAKQSRERHEVVLQFLIALGVSEPTAVTDSEGIEHHVSAETLQAMRSFLNEQ
jgi:DtxR family manganese transport transcriptional regulator